MFDKLFNKDPHKELARLFEQEQEIYKKIELLNSELEKKQDDEGEDVDFVALAVTLADKKRKVEIEIDAYKQALIHLGKKRAKYCSMIDEQNIRNARLALKKNEADCEQVSSEIDVLAPKLHALKAEYERLSIKLYNYRVPDTFWGKNWTIQQLREVMDSPECPFVDRPRIQQIVRDYDEFTSRSPYSISPTVTADEIGEITHVHEDPTEGLKKPHFFKQHVPFMPHPESSKESSKIRR